MYSSGRFPTVGLVVMQLDKFGHGSSLADITKFLEACLEAVHLCKRNSLGFGVGVVMHHNAQDTHKWVGINGGGVIGIVTRIHSNMDSASL